MPEARRPRRPAQRRGGDVRARPHTRQAAAAAEPGTAAGSGRTLRRRLHDWARTPSGPARTGAALLLAAAVAAIGLVPIGLEAALRSESGGERGMYDLLVRSTVPAATAVGGGAGSDASGSDVTPEGAAAGPSRPSGRPGAGDGTDGELRFPPNTTLAPGMSRLTREDLAAIRAVPGVAVAAPVTRLTASFYRTSTVSFAVPVAVGQPDLPPEAYTAKLRIVDDDGTGPRVLRDSTLVVIIDRSDREHTIVLPPESFGEDASCDIDGEVVPMTDPRTASCRTIQQPPVTVRTLDSDDSTISIGLRVDDWIVFTLLSAPSESGALTLVDPAAESALLGDRARFLAPLARLDERFHGATARMTDLERWEAEEPGALGSGLESTLRQAQLEASWYAAMVRGEERPMPPGDEQRETISELQASFDDPVTAEQFAASANTPVLPIVAAAGGRAPRLELTVEDAGAATALGPDPLNWNTRYAVPDALERGDAGTPLGAISTSIDASSDPHARPLQWPGFAQGGVPPDAATVDPRWGATAVRLERLGLPEPSDATSLHADGRDTGWMTTVDTSASEGGLRFDDGTPLTFRSPDSGFSLTPVRPSVVERVGTPVIVLDPEAASPLGAYDDGTGTWVRDADGRPVDPAVVLGPTSQGAGIADSGTRYLAPLAAVADATEETRLIDAVRVRVDVPGTTADAAARIADVAARLDAAGFEAIAVAGAERMPVDVAVEDWLFPGEVAPHPLGTVTQEWLRIPAAALSAADGRGTLAVAGAVVLAGAVLAAAARVGRRRRRRGAEVLAALGATRRQLLGRAASAWAVPSALVLVGVESAVAAAGGNPATGVLGTAAAAWAVGVAAWTVRSETRGLGAAVTTGRSEPAAAASGFASTSLARTSLERASLERASLEPASILRFARPAAERPDAGSPTTAHPAPPAPEHPAHPAPGHPAPAHPAPGHPAPPAPGHPALGPVRPAGATPPGAGRDADPWAAYRRPAPTPTSESAPEPPATPATARDAAPRTPGAPVDARASGTSARTD